MSRSYRKPYWVDGYGSVSKKLAKRRAAHTVRRTEDIANGSAYRKVYNPWDICDFKFIDLKNPKVGRK